MSYKTTMSGYSGYVPGYQTQYPTHKNVPAHKYEDIDIQQKSLMEGSTWRSNHQASYNSPRFGRHVPHMLPEGSKFQRATEMREKTIQARDIHEYEQRPTYWETSYNATHQAWDAHNNVSRPLPLPSFENGPKHILTGTNDTTSYSRSFGRYGDNPRENYVYGDGKKVFSARATTRDLFVGTNKNSVRIPSYAGYVPNSENNRGTIRDNVAYNTKDNLIQTYDHNVPGYTGHKPEAVKNDKGPRDPSGKCKMAAGLHTGMMFGSMKEQ